MIVAVGVIKSVAKTDKGGAGKVTKVRFNFFYKNNANKSIGCSEGNW